MHAMCRYYNCDFTPNLIASALRYLRDNEYSIVNGWPYKYLEIVLFVFLGGWGVLVFRKITSVMWIFLSLDVKKTTFDVGLLTLPIYCEAIY